ncbi:flagellar basal body P-ring formation chaperone FlgA [Agrobacterium sp.]|jgi:flagella basal body P-ring formation protein FlgA|uniref:flagellar basal body P-ring formation chaperone FlgA n=1 Tax=Agrobacterium sp. TaxID=361 RepID=UPI0028A6D143
MKFSRKNSRFNNGLVRLCIASVLSVVATSSVAQAPVALVPTRIIYPGEVISADALKEVEVTNPNISNGYASEVGQIEGLISKQTLLPGRTIPVAALRIPYAVTRGASVRLTFTIGHMTISAAGTPMQDGGVGDVVRVRNIDSGVIVNGTVMRDGSIQVMAK